MRLFEQFEVPDMVIYVANTAVSTAMPDDPNIVSQGSLSLVQTVYMTWLSG